MIADVLFFERPYRHFLCFDTFGDDDAEAMREVLSSDLDWGVREGSFYVTYRLDLRAFFAGRAAPRFLREDFLMAMRDRMSEIFSAPLSSDVQVLGHRMIPGQKIGVHNDNPGLGFENYRAVTQFTLDHRPDDGGELNIHASDRPEDVYQRVRPCVNMTFGFETSPRSYHSVNEVRNRNRDAILFNFWHAGNAPGVEKTIRSAIDVLRQQENTLHAVSAGIDSGLDAARLAAGLARQWGLAPRVGAAAALLALDSVAAPDSTMALRDALADKWRGVIGLAGQSPIPPLPAMAAHLAPGFSDDVAAAGGMLTLLIWVARAPRRMFSAARWEAARARVEPVRDRLTGSARLLADTIFPPPFAAVSPWPAAGHEPVADST